MSQRLDHEVLTQQLIDAYEGGQLSDPTVDRTRPLNVALYGSITPWRQTFKNLFYESGRPISWFDPSDGFTHIDDPYRYITELQHFHDDIRVSVIESTTSSKNSMLELDHMLEWKMRGPLVALLKPELDIHADVTHAQRQESNRLRKRMQERLEEASGSPNLHVVSSIEQAVFVTSALVAQLQ